LIVDIIIIIITTLILLFSLIIIFVVIHFGINPNKGGIPANDKIWIEILLNDFSFICSFRFLILFFIKYEISEIEIIE